MSADFSKRIFTFRQAATSHLRNFFKVHASFSWCIFYLQTRGNNTGIIPVIPNPNSTVVSMHRVPDLSTDVLGLPQPWDAGGFTQPVVNNQDLPISVSWLWSSGAAQELILFAKKVSLWPFSPSPEQTCWDKHRRAHEQAKNFLVFKQMFWFKQNDQPLNLGKVQPHPNELKYKPKNLQAEFRGCPSALWDQPRSEGHVLPPHHVLQHPDTSHNLHQTCTHAPASAVSGNI